MVLVLVFGVALLVAVLLSGVAARSVLSTSLLFLVAGALVGDGVLGWIHVTPDSAIVSDAADIALFTVLFTDGAKLRRLRGEGSWQGPLRALGIGMPLTFVLVALLAHYLAELDWLPALLAGAVLAPTDPVFASAIVSRTDVPARLRRLLSIESGLNDGLALPVVLLLLASTGFVSPHEPTSVPQVLLELGGGVLLGIVAPVAAWALFRIPRLGVPHSCSLWVRWRSRQACTAWPTCWASTPTSPRSSVARCSACSPRNPTTRSSPSATSSPNSLSSPRSWCSARSSRRRCSPRCPPAAGWWPS